jgi:Domain of unknown function (DUF222)/HNH endonuclease
MRDASAESCATEALRISAQLWRRGSSRFYLLIRAFPSEPQRNLPNMCSGADSVGRPGESGASLDELEREICELAAHLAAATCRWLLLVAEWDERRGWADWGVKSCAHWLSWRCSIGLVAAREHVRVARRLRELPLVTEAFGTGELSYCKVRAITRVATPQLEAHLVEMGRQATGSQLEKIVRGYSGAVRATLGRAQDAHSRREVTWLHDDDGSLVLRARLPADDGALLLAALKAAESWLPESRATDGTSEDIPVVTPAAERRADALVAIARAGLDSGENRRGGDPCEVVVHVDAQSLVGDEVKSCSELADGPVLSPETVRRLGCDAALVRIIERDGRPLTVGRRTRTIPPALRRALRARDEGCRFPGCTHQRFLHAHHIHHWARGGETKLDNLVQLCSHHHRLVHEGGFQVERGGHGAVRFRRPDGKVIPGVGRPLRARGPSLECQHVERGLVIDDQTCLGKSVGFPCDYGIAVEVLCARAGLPP